MSQDRWDIRREGRRWTREEFENQIVESRPRIALGEVIFVGESQRYVLLALLLKDVGIDAAVRFGNLADWKAAIADLEQHKTGMQS